jgi:hypothetical protein
MFCCFANFRPIDAVSAYSIAEALPQPWAAALDVERFLRFSRVTGQATPNPKRVSGRQSY